MSDTLTFNGMAKLRPRYDANREVRIKLAEQIADLQKTAEARDAVLLAAEAELATLRAENAHLKRALELVDALRNKERNLPL